MPGRVLPAVALAGIPGAPAAQPPAAADLAFGPYAKPSTLAQLPDRRSIHLRCVGSGSPTVVLTAGIGDWSASWRHIQPRVSALTRVCTWDRAGFGFSSGSDLPQSIANTTAELWAALGSASIAGPYVLVGHSYGGLESVAFRDRSTAGWVSQVGVCRDALAARQTSAMAPDACRGSDVPVGYPDALSHALGQLDRHGPCKPSMGFDATRHALKFRVPPADVCHLLRACFGGISSRIRPTASGQRKQDSGCRFRAVSGSSQPVSERQPSINASTLGGIEFVRVNGQVDARFERKAATNNQPFFTLKAANSEPLGRSETYATKASMKNGIRPVIQQPADATIKDHT